MGKRKIETARKHGEVGVHMVSSKLSDLSEVWAVKISNGEKSLYFHCADIWAAYQLEKIIMSVEHVLEIEFS